MLGPTYQMKLNGIQNPNNIQSGVKLKLPDKKIDTNLEARKIHRVKNGNTKAHEPTTKKEKPTTRLRGGCQLMRICPLKKDNE